MRKITGYLTKIYIYYTHKTEVCHFLFWLQQFIDAPQQHILRKATGCRKNNNIYQIYIPRPSVSPIMQQDVCPIRCYPLPLLA
ncbi:hypothetical protein [Coprobacter secundus]|uniref:hypothetical protein n=1 Tax=Coprobacter secundus TaxID=1501392 RepID=UPI0012F99BC1